MKKSPILKKLKLRIDAQNLNKNYFWLGFLSLIIINLKFLILLLLFFH